MAVELESSITNPVEKTALLCNGLSFSLALTLAFSVKGSGSRVTPVTNQYALGSADLQVADITANASALEFAG